MLSIIVKEHKETPEKILKILSQAEEIRERGRDVELLFMTSMDNKQFLDKYQPWKYSYNLTVYGNVMSCGAAVNMGANYAKGDELLVVDCHICFDTTNLDILMRTLENNPMAMVTPALKHVDFPVCDYSTTALGYGARFKVSSKNSFEWIWLGAERTDEEYPVPLACACAFAIKKNVFSELLKQGYLRQAFNFEEERSMRLWRMGYPTLIEPRAVFGHWFKPHMSSTQVQDWYYTRICSLYVNILEENNWNRLEKTLSKAWKNQWTIGLEFAKENYTWLRDIMMKYKDNIDENWFVTTED